MKTTPKTIVRRSPIHGRGLFAAEVIRKGTVIGEYQGPKAKRNGKYVLWLYDETGTAVEGRVGRNKMKFVNHSRKKANAEFQDYHLVALRPIRAGDEILFDYNAAEKPT